MIICIVMYLVLVCLIVAKRKGRLSRWFVGKNGTYMLIILFVSNTIAMGLFRTDLKEEKESGVVRRNSYGEGKRRDTYHITVGEELQDEELMIDVEERKYTSKEIREIFKEITADMEETILGENESPDYVDQNLNLVTEWETYPVHIRWEMDHYDVMNMYGEILTEKTVPEGTLVELRAILEYEGEEALYVTNVKVYPKEKSKEEMLIEEVNETLKAQEEATREKEKFSLPQSVKGEKITWVKKIEPRGYYVLILGSICAFLMPLQKKQNEQKEIKKKKEQMITDYPEIINKFTLLLSTGMNTKSVWERIVKNYEEQKKITGERAAYEEMRYTCNEMQSGITESEAYERFGKRCGIPVYIKFGAMLTQNLKKGTKGMADILRNESVQAFENRKSRARQQGEEAGTKLLVPLFGMLAVVLVIVIVPAFLSIQL